LRVYLTFRTTPYFGKGRWWGKELGRRVLFEGGKEEAG